MTTYTRKHMRAIIFLTLGLALGLQTQPAIELELSDGTIEITKNDFEILQQNSSTISKLMEDLGSEDEDNSIPLPVVSKKDYGTLSEFLKIINNTNELNAQINAITDVSTLSRLLNIATYLDIQPLIEPCSNRVADILITDKNLQNSFLQEGTINGLEELTNANLHNIIVRDILEKNPEIQNNLIKDQVKILKQGGLLFKFVAFSPDGKQVITASWDTTAKIWDTQTGELKQTLKHDDRVNSAKFSPDSNYVVTTSNDHIARIWDSQTGKLKYTLQHDDTVNSAEFSPDSNYVVTTSNDFAARIWDIRTGNIKQTLKHNDEYINSATFSRDGNYIVTASNDKTAKIWNTQTGDIEQTLPNITWVMSAAFSPDSNYVVTISQNNAAKIWDIQTANIKHKLEHNRYINSAAFSPDGKYVATASDDKTAIILNVETGETKKLQQDGPVHSAAFSPDSNYVVTASQDKTAIIWDTQTGEPKQNLEHNDAVWSAAFSPDGKYVATVSRDETARIWNINNITGIENYFKGERITIEQVLFLYLLDQTEDKNALIKKDISLGGKSILESFPYEMQVIIDPRLREKARE